MPWRRLLLALGLALTGTAWPATLKTDIFGADPALQQNVLAHLGKIEQAQLERPEQLQQQVTQRIDEAARGLGYYQLKSQLQISEKRLAITLQPGERVRVRSVSLHCDDPGHDFATLLKQWPLPVGSALHHGQYEHFKRSLQSRARRLGYLEARFSEQQIRIDSSRNYADVRLRFEPGPRYRFGALVFQGSQLSPQQLNKLAPFKQGDAYDEDKLAELQSNLEETQYFKQVELTPGEPSAHDHQVPIRVLLTDRAQHRNEFGLGFGTDSGPTGRLSWERPLINERGDSLRSSLELSSIRQSLDARYRIPQGSPLKRYWEIGTALEQETLQDTESTSSTLSLAHVRVFDSGWQWRRYLNLEYDDFQQGEQDQSGFYPMPGMGLSRLVSDHPITPQQGYRLWLETTGGAESWGSATDLFYTRAGARWLQPLAQHHQLLLRTELGALATADQDEVPPKYRFFTGGDQSIRGYDYQSLAPQYDDGKLRGGRYLNVLSGEYSWRFSKSWGVALFCDTGRAYDHVDDPWHTGAGLGLRWHSPVGLIRVDLASAVSENPESLRLHISMGPAL